MKGYGIEIKNDLLEPKHVAAMGPSPVFLYMWLIDKMTSIDEKGVGKVLGGKPIIFEDVQQDLGVPERTYRRWLNQLRKSGYINTTRTPRGLSITVNKAFKRFGKKTDMPKVAHHPTKGYAKNGTSDMPDVAHRLAKSGTSNKTVTVDSNSKTLSKDKGEAPQKGDPSVNKIMEAFKVMGYKPTNVKQQRRYAKNLVSREGVEEVINVLRVYYVARGEQYCPTITNPKQLYYKWDDLRQFIVKHKTKKSKVAKV